MPAQTRKAAAAKSTAAAPAFDLSSLSVADATMPKGSRSSVTTNSPFPAFMQDSKDRGVGKSVTVPASQVKRVVYLIRAAANDMQIGSRIVTQDTNGATLDKDALAALIKSNPNASVVVLFAAKNRKQRKSTSA